MEPNWKCLGLNGTLGLVSRNLELWELPVLMEGSAIIAVLQG
jgi:hypothetical protein